MLAMIITGAVASKLPVQRFLVVVGLVMVAYAMWHFTSLSQQADFTTLLWIRVLQVIGLSAEKSNEAFSLSSLLSNPGGSLGIAWVVNLMH